VTLDWLGILYQEMFLINKCIFLICWHFSFRCNAIDDKHMRRRGIFSYVCSKPISVFLLYGKENARLLNWNIYRLGIHCKIFLTGHGYTAIVYSQETSTFLSFPWGSESQRTLILLLSNLNFVKKERKSQYLTFPAGIFLFLCQKINALYR
jgi:hypothetical protein